MEQLFRASESNNADVPIQGGPDTEHLVVFVPGMLYETERPPEHCVLRSVRKKLLDCALTLMVPRTRREAEDVYELPPTEQADRILGALGAVSTEYGGHRKVHYVAHSAGAIVVNYLNSTNDHRSSLYIAPPSPVLPAVDQIQDCLSRLMPIDPDRSQNDTTVYRSRQGHNFVVGADVWNDIRKVEALGVAGEDSRFIVASRDRVFPESYLDWQQRHPTTTTVLDDTHSFKEASSANAISNLIVAEMLHYK